MAGYYGYSMSNNAVEAYHNGEAPASKIPGIPTDLVRQYGMRTAYHHTSSQFNETDFFDVAQTLAVFGKLTDDWAANLDDETDPVDLYDEDAAKALAEYRAAEKTATATVYENQTVEWIDWRGSRSHPRAVKMSAVECRVTVKGKTATVDFPDGTKLKKRLSTNGFRFYQIKEEEC